ncbi:MAG: 8-amino-7-oxononanoate synthase, partial [Planctomycetota bacterium]
MAETTESNQVQSHSSGLQGELRAELDALEAVNRLRTLKSGAQSLGVDFSSNDYLGLSRHAVPIEAADVAAREYGSSGRASRLLCGGLPAHEHLERTAAEWLQVDGSLFFPSGYQANLGLLGALLRRGDALFSDELNHASIIDGSRLSRARLSIYPHFDLEQLEAKLALRMDARRRIVITESVFSMDGDLAPLAEIDELCERYNAWLIVDEAHAVGLLGPEGAGACAALDHKFKRLAARLITGGKALGVSGALIAGSNELREVLINRARSFVFTTAPPPALAASFAAAIDVVRTADAEREQTLRNARVLAAALDLPEPAAAIVPFPASGEEDALALQAKLNLAGLDVRAIRPPTVPAGESRLRIVCHANNTAAELDELTRQLKPHVRVAPALPAKLAPTLFVSGTDTDIGKTVVSALLTRGAQRLGSARYWKPVQTGSDSDTDEVARLAEIKKALLLPPAFHFSEPASPHTAARADGRE